MKKGQKMTLEQRKRMSEWQKWRIPRNKGTVWLYSEEYRRKIWDKSKWRTHTKESKEKIRQKMLWRVVSEETRKKLSDCQKWEKWNNYGKKASEETRKKLSLVHNGKKLSKEHINKIRISQMWEKNIWWRWWITNSPYSTDWTNTLKRSIRERDKYTCRICLIQQDERMHAIHHIDYDKNNCNPNNLVTLCNSCHAKTNTNREYRINFFNNFNF